MRLDFLWHPFRCLGRFFSPWQISFELKKYFGFFCVLLPGCFRFGSLSDSFGMLWMSLEQCLVTEEPCWIPEGQCQQPTWCVSCSALKPPNESKSKNARFRIVWEWRPCVYLYSLGDSEVIHIANSQHFPWRLPGPFWSPSTSQSTITRITAASDSKPFPFTFPLHFSAPAFLLFDRFRLGVHEAWGLIHDADYERGAYFLERPMPQLSKRGEPGRSFFVNGGVRGRR